MSTPTKRITLELLEQGGITRHWDSLIRAMRASVASVTETEIADACRKLRGRELVAFALWVDTQVHGYTVMEPVTYKGEMAMNVYSIYGSDLSIDDWGEFIDQAIELLRGAGFKRLIAFTTNPRVLEIVRRTGWDMYSYCERIL